MKPAGEPEAKLLEAVEADGSVAAFARKVASRTGHTEASEKGAFYRIVREGRATKTARELRRLYAELLKQPAAPWIVQERPGASAESPPSLLLDRLRAVEDEVVRLREERDVLVQEMLARLDSLEEAAQIASQRGLPRASGGVS